MAKRKLLDDILRDPVRYYRVPGDVLRDRRFDSGEKRAILKAWRGLAATPEAQIAAALHELQARAELDMKLDMKEGAG